MVKFLWVASVFFAIAGAFIWMAFLRAVPVQHATAEIKAKTYKPAGTYWQQQVGIDRGFRTATPIAIDESFVLELYSHEMDSSGFFAVPIGEHAKYLVGQRVSIEYQRRGLPLFGYRTFVLSVRPQ